MQSPGLLHFKSNSHNSSGHLSQESYNKSSSIGASVTGGSFSSALNSPNIRYIGIWVPSHTASEIT